MPDREGPDVDGVRAFPGGVKVSSTDRVTAVLLDRPAVRNAQSFATWSSLATVAETLPADTRVVLLRGSGGDFSSGLDLRLLRAGGLPAEGSLSDLVSGSDEEIERTLATFQLAFSRWRDLPAVVIAVVRGRAIGAGFQLALAADLRIAETGAVFDMAEPRLGLVPDLGGTHRLVELVGFARALEICTSTRPVTATQAAQWGLVNRVVPDDQLDWVVQARVDELCSLPAESAAAVKDLLSKASTRGYPEQLAAERGAQVPLLRSLAARSG
ncbi:enoyl-CoA hydratase/isomerase family protein [Microlunatus panaciterrae]|uniref:Enoyl-CoA hydratase/carnithine racemase n=1 Tax=Microlunatus panaciterrae TaxID=400768 RepID=A0ABS2RMR4_9ACTN|nr:enoyl-CoA hydratase/isomerase family protein [Microlunatus panaciterrae]MBM7800267.1 enoyl-CoA hydratase/carnithine racemase [Microlunatus panaciterrae]